MCSLPASFAFAEAELEITAHVEQIENPERLPENSDGELLSQLFARAAIQRETQRFNTEIDYQARKLEYREDLLDDRSFVEGTSAVTWKAIPDTLSWNLSNSRSFQTIDNLLPDNSNNRQVISVTSTGPEISYRLGAATRADLQLDYTLADYEESAIPGQQRRSAFLSLSRMVSRRYTAGINASVIDASFDATDLLDFEIYSLSLLQNFTTETYRLSLELGRDETRRNLQPDQDNLLLDFEGSYKINTNSELSASYSRSAEDILRNIQLSTFQADATLDERLSNSNLTQTFEQRRRTLSYTYTNANLLSFTLGYERVARLYDLSPDTQIDQSLTATTVIPAGTRFSMTLFGRYTQLDFPDAGREQNRREAGAVADYRLNRHFTLRFSVRYTDQNGSDFLDNYDGLNSFISLTFRI